MKGLQLRNARSFRLDTFKVLVKYSENQVSLLKMIYYKISVDSPR